MLKTLAKTVAVVFLLASFFSISGCRKQPVQPPKQVTEDIYPEPAAANAEIQNALATAAREYKRVILDFGGNWCGDCKVLNIYYHQEPNASLLAANYVLVDVNICRMDCNTDIADKYAVPLKKGVPALAVLDSNGTLLYSQRNGEFESMRRMDSNSVTDFLNTWKPKG